MDKRRFILLGTAVAGAQLMTSMANAQEEKINVKEWQAASKLLLDTAVLIEKNGWQQGATTAVPQECLSTALEKAFRADPALTLVDLNYAKALLYEEIGAQEPSLSIVANAKDQPAVPYWGVAFMDWNDKEGQTAENVIGTLKNLSGKAYGLAKEASQ